MRIQKKVILGAGLTILMTLAGCKTGQQEEAAAPTLKVRVHKVNTSDYVLPVNCTGKLSTKTESKLSFKTGGIIERILADEGQSVKKGQLLAELNLEEIRSRVTQAELVLRKAERDFKRAENLFRDSVATLEQFENARTALDVARTNNRIARFNLRFSSIHAPADGKILKRVAETNEIIGAGHPVFLFASMQNDWVVRANLTDRDVLRINMFDSARVFFDAYGDEAFIGQLSEIGTGADPYTGTYEIEIQLLHKPEKPVSGFIARIDIFPSDAQEKIIIPYESLVDGVGLTGYVYVLHEGVPRRTKIRIESFSDSGIVVSSGLVGGEEIIVEGAQYLRKGSRIEVVKPVH